MNKKIMLRNKSQTVPASQIFTGNPSFTGAPVFSGTPVFSGPVSLTGAAALSGTPVISGPASFTGNPTFSGTPVFSAAQTFSGTANINGSLVAGTASSVSLQGTTTVAASAVLRFPMGYQNALQVMNGTAIAFYWWVNSGGTVRISGTAPVADTGGTAVGAQT